MLTQVQQQLPRTTPESQGIASSAVLQFIEALERQKHELHSVMLLRHGSVVAEGWWSPYEPAHPHMIFSLSKSFTSTAVGLAVAEGYFSLDDLVLSFFAEESPAQVSDFLAVMSVRHLLTMSTGHAVDTWAYMMERPDGNWIKAFLEVPVQHQPGTYFLYNTGATYMLAAIVQKTTGAKLIDYLEPRLFAPLGIENATWQESPQGIARGGIGLSLKTEDIARFGQLYLQKGQWQESQILPEGWVEAATTTQMSNGDAPDSDWTQGYGYQFWRCRHGAYRGDGVFGQYCVVMPEQDAVIAITGGMDIFDMQQPLDLVWELLLPAMEMNPLADNDAAHSQLTQKLSNLSFVPAQGQATSPMANQFSGRTYAIEANELGLNTITLDFAESGYTVRVNTAAGEEVIQGGYSQWQQGQTTLFHPLDRDWLDDNPTPIVASGDWMSQDSFTIVVRLYETPFCHTIVCHFAGDELLIEMLVNVSFEASNVLLTARLVA